MKEFFRYPVIGIDRILSSGIRSQLLLLVGVIAGVLVLFILIEWVTGSILTIDQEGERNLWFDVYYHFVDPGNQYVVNGGANRLLVSIVSVTGSVLGASAFVLLAVAFITAAAAVIISYSISLCVFGKKEF